AAEHDEFVYQLGDVETDTNPRNPMVPRHLHPRGFAPLAKGLAGRRGASQCFGQRNEIVRHAVPQLCQLESWGLDDVALHSFEPELLDFLTLVLDDRSQAFSGGLAWVVH